MFAIKRTSTSCVSARLFSTTTLRASNIGSTPIIVPADVKVTVAPLDDPIVTRKGRTSLKLSKYATITGPRGELKLNLPDFLQVREKESKLTIKVKDETKKQQKALWGTMRALINNHIDGVVEGHMSILRLVGTGYRAQLEEKDGKKFLGLKVGASIPQGLFIPDHLTVTSPSTTRIIIEGIDKQQVRLFAAKIREFHPPEPYKGKGIYVDSETIKIKDKKIK
ncbi:hypothetical protein WICPIJ_008666 [Wickerhamomyces pijperi]|uniref:Large ribosomal subunit protein uL6m n=1 Tax=Wickerhamomyces pijperi TaxID=599730 RepID=A0A9P8PVL5_WICPI|nr:hypothetical protein WICPIJ_008666 [Wickerhamomyces pijperi]